MRVFWKDETGFLVLFMHHWKPYRGDRIIRTNRKEPSAATGARPKPTYWNIAKMTVEKVTVVSSHSVRL